MPKHVKTRKWVTKAVWQQIPDRWARKGKTPTTKTVQPLQTECYVTDSCYYTHLFLLLFISETTPFRYTGN